MAQFLELIVVGLCCIFIRSSQQLSSSQAQILYQLRKQLEYPKQLEAWKDAHVDFCYLPATPFLMLTCEQNSVTVLKIVGDKVASTSPSKYGGYSIQERMLSQSFSIASFVTTLTRLPNLKVLILVSLGMWGALPEKIHRLNSLEVLDLSSNYLYGTIPPRLSSMTRLNTITFDGNYFNDTVPDWLSSLTNLTNLSMQRNKFRGPLPNSISSVKTLTKLSLARNHISGKIPDISKLTNLEVFDVRDNNLDSELPYLPISLVSVLLSNNSLKGEIPYQYGGLNRLQHLDISFNMLGGNPPSVIFSLPNISYINLESNMLSGSLSSELACSNQLGFVDISTNRLSGELPSCLISYSNKRVVKFDGNCLRVDVNNQHDSNYCLENGMENNSNVGIMIASIVGIVFVLIFVSIVLVVFCRKKCQRAIAEQSLLPKSVPETSATSFSSELLANARCITQDTNYGATILPTYRVFSLEELREATRNFDIASLIGEGSIGKLYRGRLENGTYVAIRCLPLFKKYSIRNLKLRLDLLSKLRHPNLVCLLGHCINSSQDDSSVNTIFLIYEHVPNGNLKVHLSENNPEKVLKWNDRLTVLTCIAKAVHFLHTGIIPGFFSNRIKSSSILLDEHNIVKVSDYGLSIISEEIYKQEAKGENQKGIQSKAAAKENINVDDDVYSVGLIILEVLLGSSYSEKGETFFLNQLDELFSNQEEIYSVVDPILRSACASESVSIVTSIMNKCLTLEATARPSIEDVLWNLQYASQVQATADSDVRTEVCSQA